MHALRLHFDPISPFAWLAFDALPQALAGCSVVIDYQPVLFAGLLQHHGQKGPAEIGPKRVWTYRQVAWLAHRQGTPLTLPATHPFNPLPLLRLALACAPTGGLPNRRVVEALFRFVWDSGGAEAQDPDRLAALTAELVPVRDPAGAEVKAELRAATESAIAAGVFGVPTLTWRAPEAGAADRVFWGADALPMLAAALQGDPWFDSPAWHDAGASRPGLSRG